MIELENTEVFGWEAAIRGMRNPMNSWSVSDSDICEERGCGGCSRNYEMHCAGYKYGIGNNDYTLMKSLVKAGSDHSKFMRTIYVSVDVTAPMYWWKEADTYKVGTVRNSCSSMHMIHERAFMLDDFSHDQLNLDSMEMLKKTVELLNYYRSEFANTKSKNTWWQMIQLLPSSYNQRATWFLNYAVLRNIYHARKNHKLDEWKEFCKWIETLPYSELITNKGESYE